MSRSARPRSRGTTARSATPSRPARPAARLAADRDVVEHPAGLRIRGVHAGEALQVPTVVAELDHPRLDPDPIAVEVGHDVELLDVEAEVIEPLDALLDPPHLAGGELLLAGE